MEKYKCIKCNGLGMPSKAFLNTMIYFDDFGGDVGQTGTTGSRQGKAELVDVIKCQDCGHSWIPEKETNVKYTLICFTFNKVKVMYPTATDTHRLELRNNWIEYAKDVNHLSECLFALGIRGVMPTFEKREDVVKLSGNFTLPNTRIIVHIIKN